MVRGFRLFGAPHLLILALIAALAWLLARRGTRTSATLLGWSLGINEIVWYSYRYSTEGFRFPEGLPLQLCDVAVWLTVAALLTRRDRIFELAYLAGLPATAMALLTPDLWAPLLSYPSLYFFAAHGGVFVGAVFLAVSGLSKLEPGCVLRGLLAANAFALAVGAFNAYFHTNYMYLCRKPDAASVLDRFGPWPFYLIGGEVLAFLLILALWLPFRKQGRIPHAGR